MYNPYAKCIPFHVNRDTRRKVERYRSKYPELTFTQAYNKVFNTNYDDPSKVDEYDTSGPSNNVDKYDTR